MVSRQRLKSVKLKILTQTSFFQVLVVYFTKFCCKIIRKRSFRPTVSPAKCTNCQPNAWISFKFHSKTAPKIILELSNHAQNFSARSTHELDNLTRYYAPSTILKYHTRESSSFFHDIFSSESLYNYNGNWGECKKLGLLGVKMGRVDDENLHHISDTSRIRLQHFFELVKNKKSIQKLKFEISRFFSTFYWCWQSLLQGA